MKAGYVSFVGRPNAGKSTLMNKLMGQKVAIVSDKPQTTRTRILGAKTHPDGQILFLDTPGVHRPMHRMNVRMVDAAVGAAREADVVALVVDASEEVGRGTEFLLGLLPLSMWKSFRTSVSAPPAPTVRPGAKKKISPAPVGA